MFNVKPENGQATVTRLITNLMTCLNFKLFRNCDHTLLFQKEITRTSNSIDVIPTECDWSDGRWLMNLSCSLGIKWFSLDLANVQFKLARFSDM